MNLPHLLRPAPLRKRLWQMAMLLALVTLAFVAVNAMQPAGRSVTRQMLGHDFLAFYTAGTFVREGHSADLYDLQKIADHQAQVAAGAGLAIDVSFAEQNFGPWWNPPLFALVFVPLSLLPFGAAAAVWTLLNLAAAAWAVSILINMLAPRWLEHDSLDRPIDWKTTGLVPLLILLSMPFVQAMSHGQNTLISLLLLALAAKFWRSKRAILAGACCALMCYKPQLTAVVACVLVISLGWRALLGLVLVGSAMVLASQLAMPGMLVEWLQRLPENVHYMQVENAYLWDRHVTLKAFWRLLVQGRGPGEMGWAATSLHLLSFVALATLLVRCAWSHVRSRGESDDAWGGLTQKGWRDRLIAATLCCAPLLMPFYFDYDLLLLAIPAVLLAGEQLARPADRPLDRADAWMLRGWIVFYGWLVIGPAVSGFMPRLNLTPVLLAGIALMMLRRATRPPAARAGGTGLDVADDAGLLTIAGRRAA